MEEITIFDQGRTALINFINNEYKGFDQRLLSHFLNSFNELLDYREEGTHTKPKIIFTNNIDSIIKVIPKAYKIQIFVDQDASMFNSRLKPLIAIAKKEWCIYIENKDDKFIYGICKALNSLKEKGLITQIRESNYLRDRADRISCIVAKSINDFEMDLFSTRGNKIKINTALNPSSTFNNDDTITEFTKACFSRLRTTQKKLGEVQVMFSNIFSKVIDDLNGAMCVIVDKDYKDNGFFEDGIWLETPISFSKLFTQSKSYSEEKLQAFATLLINMLNFDGITVIDTTGQVLAYNVFVQNNMNRTKNVIGGARKRAAYTIINSRRKHIVGLYFQSHEGEIFYKSLKKEKAKAETKPQSKVQEAPPTQTSAVENTTNEKDSLKEKTEILSSDKAVEHKSLNNIESKPPKSETQKLEVNGNIVVTEPIITENTIDTTSPITTKNSINLSSLARIDTNIDIPSSTDNVTQT